MDCFICIPQHLTLDEKQRHHPKHNSFHFQKMLDFTHRLITLKKDEHTCTKTFRQILLLCPLFSLYFFSCFSLATIWYYSLTGWCIYIDPATTPDRQLKLTYGLFPRQISTRTSTTYSMKAESWVQTWLQLVLLGLLITGHIELH